MNDEVTSVECFVPLLIFFVIASVLAIAQNRRAGLNEAYKRLAHRYDGSYWPGDWFSTPSVRFHYEGVNVVVDLHKTGGRHARYYTQVHMSWPDPEFRCEIFPESMLSRIGRAMGVQDIKIGSPDFDERYVVRSSSPQETCNFLSGAVQFQVDKIRHLLGNGHVHVKFEGGRLVVRKRSLIRDDQLLSALTALALELHAHALLTQSAGIEFENETVAQPVGEPTCQVCGEGIKENELMVICRRCKTPHHRDCWEYTSVCSTYGCGEFRYFVPRTARRAPKSDNRGSTLDT